jgi:hypothetical protein
VVSFTARPLYSQGKSAWYPLDRRLGGPQSRAGLGGEEKNSQLLPGIVPQNPDLLARRGLNLASFLIKGNLPHTILGIIVLFLY